MTSRTRKLTIGVVVVVIAVGVALAFSVRDSAIPVVVTFVRYENATNAVIRLTNRTEKLVDFVCAPIAREQMLGWPIRGRLTAREIRDITLTHMNPTLPDSGVNVRVLNERPEPSKLRQCIVVALRNLGIHRVKPSLKLPPPKPSP